GDVQLPRHLEVAHPLPTTEHDPGAHRHSLRRLRSKRDHFQFVAVLFRDFQRFLGTPSTHTQVCSLTRTYATYFSLRTLDLNSSAALFYPSCASHWRKCRHASRQARAYPNRKSRFGG